MTSLPVLPLSVAYPLNELLTNAYVPAVVISMACFVPLDMKVHPDIVAGLLAIIAFALSFVLSMVQPLKVAPPWVMRLHRLNVELLMVLPERKSNVPISVNEQLSTFTSALSVTTRFPRDTVPSARKDTDVQSTRLVALRISMTLKPAET